MRKYPVKVQSHESSVVERDAVEVIGADRAAGFFSFHYSYTEISGGAAPRLKSRKASFENGKVTSETFEGSLDPQAYEDIVRGSTRFFLNQTIDFMKALLQFMPHAGRHRGERD